MTHHERSYNFKSLAGILTLLIIVLISGMLLLDNAHARAATAPRDSADTFTLPAQQPEQPVASGPQKEVGSGEDPEDPPDSTSTADHSKFAELQQDFATGSDVRDRRQ